MLIRNDWRLINTNT